MYMYMYVYIYIYICIHITINMIHIYIYIYIFTIPVVRRLLPEALPRKLASDFGAADLSTSVNTDE